jgi:hypothetical protein
MSKEKQIKEVLRQLTNQKGTTIFTAEVVKVDATTCDAKLADGHVCTKIRLRATSAGDSFFIIRPKAGSIVKVLSERGGLENLSILSIDEIENIELKTADLQFLFDTKDGKVQLKNQKASLLDLLLDISATIKTITVTTPSGPSGTPLPPTLAKLNALETKLKTLLK